MEDLVTKCQAHIAEREARMGEGTQGKWSCCVDGIYGPTEGDCAHCSYEPRVCEPAYTEDARNIAYRHNTCVADLELVKGLLGVRQACMCSGKSYICSGCERLESALQSWLTTSKARYEEVYESR